MATTIIPCRSVPAITPERAAIWQMQELDLANQVRVRNTRRGGRRDVDGVTAEGQPFRVLRRLSIGIGMPDRLRSIGRDQPRHRIAC
jgi:hypothetical protein